MKKRKIQDDVQNSAKREKTTFIAKQSAQPQSYLFSKMPDSEKQNLEKMRHDLKEVGLSPPKLARNP